MTAEEIHGSSSIARPVAVAVSSVSTTAGESPPCSSGTCSERSPSSAIFVQISRLHPSRESRIFRRAPKPYCSAKKRCTMSPSCCCSGVGLNRMESSYRPRIVWAMMFFWISFEPP